MTHSAEFSIRAGTPKRPLRVLIVEDTPADAELVIAALKQTGYSTSLDVVDSPEEFEQKLAGPGYDIILADYNLRTWTVIDALEILRRVGKETPLVVVTGSLGDAAAAECIKQGAMDYVLKDRMARLPSAVERALKEKAMRDDRKRAEAQLRKLSSVVEHTADPVVITSTDGTIEYVNPAFEIGTGFPAHEAIGQTMRITKSGIHPPEFFQEFWATLLSGRPWWGTFVNRRKNGGIYFSEATVNPIFSAEGKITHFVSVQKDVTKMKQAEASLKASEERYRELFENASDAIITVDLAGNTISANKAAERLSGYTREESLGMNMAQIIAPEHLELIRQDTERLLAGNSPKPREHEIVTKGGGRVALEGSARLIYADQKPVGIQVIARDLSERKKFEEQLRQSQKMEAVGRLAGGVAHDFNNLLTIITGYSDLLLEQEKSGSQFRGQIEEIRKAAGRAAALTRQLLAFGRRQVLAPRVLNLNKIVANMDKMLQRLIGEDIDLVTNLDPALSRTRVDPSQVEQVIMNMAVNSRDAMPEGGKLTIETADAELDANYARRHAMAAPGRFVMLAVSDTGCGMDSETQSRIFEPFFTTKETGKGTGLGLATVYGIVKQIGGEIWVYSEPGRGTTFKVYFPQVEEAEQTVQPPKVVSASYRGSETILVVEDEEAVRSLVRRVLESKGYIVLTASTAEEAAPMCEQREGTISLLLTDVVMPGMSGRKLAQHLGFSRPDMKVLYMSGYTDNAIVHHGVLDPGTAFLQKPFTPDAILRKVREVLDTP